MPEECRNIYKICRKAAGFTQEAAAERLGISVESMRAYETGQRTPPDDVVDLMSILYNALHLIAWHAREKNAMYSRVVPEIQPRSVLEASAREKHRPRWGGAFSYGALKQALDFLGHALELLQRGWLGLAGADLLPDGGGELGEIGLHDRVLCKVGIPIVHTITSGGSLPEGAKVIRDKKQAAPIGRPEPDHFVTAHRAAALVHPGGLVRN